MSEESRDLWTRIREGFRKISTQWYEGATPIELRRAIQDEVAQDIEPIGGGKKIYPYTRLRIHLLAESPKERAVLEASFSEGNDLSEAVLQTLREQNCSVGELDIDIRLTNKRTDEFGERRFWLEASRPSSTRRRKKSQTAPNSPVARLSVTGGTASQKAYTLDQDRITIGRLEEVTDRYGRLRRRNDIAFTDDETEENSSVSREHARIVRRKGDFWLVDDRSAAGTRILRQGRTITVSSRDRRGVRLELGDLIYVGRATLRFQIRD